VCQREKNNRKFAKIIFKKSVERKQYTSVGCSYSYIVRKTMKTTKALENMCEVTTKTSTIYVPV